MNILLITVDQLRWDAISCSGNHEIETPHIDRLSSQGARFTHAFTNAPACMPARSSLLTGRFPHAHGVRGGGVRLSEQEVTFPQILSQRGYHTAHIGKLHVQNHTYRDHTSPHPSYGYRTLQVTDERGTYRDPYTQWVERHYPEYAKAVRIEPGASRVRNGTDHMSSEGSFPAKASHSRWVSDTSIEFLREHGGTPFMLWASFLIPIHLLSYLRIGPINMILTACLYPETVRLLQRTKTLYAAKKLLIMLWYPMLMIVSEDCFIIWTNPDLLSIQR